MSMAIALPYRLHYTRRQINSQRIFMKFCMDYLRVTRRLQ